MLAGDQARREKRLDKLINVGESEAQKACQNTQNNLTTILDREMKCQMSFQQATDTQKQQNQRLAEVSLRLKELEAKAKLCGITDLNNLDSISNASSSNSKGN